MHGTPQQWFSNIMAALGHHGWILEFHRDGYCWRSSKRIVVDPSYDGDLRQHILHEVAHIDTARFCNNAHNPQFWKHLRYLVKRFLHTDLDEHQQLHETFSSVGYYGVAYRRW